MTKPHFKDLVKVINISNNRNDFFNDRFAIFIAETSICYIIELPYYNFNVFDIFKSNYNLISFGNVNDTNIGKRYCIYCGEHIKSSKNKFIINYCPKCLR